MTPVALFTIFIALAILVRIIAGSFDGDRVEQYIRERGWVLVDKSWDPFGPGWFGEKDARIYQVVYRDTHGDLHRAHVKTSMLSGVYLTDDQIVKRAEREQGSQASSDLEAENARLRERVRELESGQG